jgi:hypothetical protein
MIGAEPVGRVSAGSGGAAGTRAAPVAAGSFAMAGEAGRGAAAGGGGSPAAIGAMPNAGAAAVQAGANAPPTETAGQAAPHEHDHCAMGEPADARDAMIMDIPDQWKSPASGDIDLVVPKLVLDWMKERVWEATHDAWHNIRRCNGGGIGLPGSASGSICSHKELIPQHQECSDAEDGYEFLVMHRHMIQSLKQAFPSQKDLFEGFPHFPYDATDVPEIWRDRWGTGWAANIKATADTLENVEKNVDMWPTEGDLGKFIQCGGMANGASSIHGALHFKWVVNDSPYSLGKQTVNIDNYMFWKLHGWIDHVWERYRAAKGLTDAEPELVQALVDQCHEMERLGAVIDPTKVVDTSSPLPAEHGMFHEQVRPILEKHCGSCHSESSPEAGMSLGGHISSADVVKNLVGVTAAHGGQFKRVVAGDAAHSWLYLKVSGTAMNAGCTGSMCNAQVMPPTGQVTLTTAELMTIEAWIDAGAAPPTQ